MEKDLEFNDSCESTLKNKFNQNSSDGSVFKIYEGMDSNNRCKDDEINSIGNINDSKAELKSDLKIELTLKTKDQSVVNDCAERNIDLGKSEDLITDLNSTKLKMPDIEDIQLTKEDSKKIDQLPYKLWIDAKNRDWILEWQGKGGRWSMRKFSCKRWGKGKAYNYAMDFLASLTTDGGEKISNYRQTDLTLPGDATLASSGIATVKNPSGSTVEDELVLQFLTQRPDHEGSINLKLLKLRDTKVGKASTLFYKDENHIFEHPIRSRQNKNDDKASAIGLGTLAAAAAAEATMGVGTRLAVRESTIAGPNEKGAVRKSGVPGVYWSQKPQGWRVVYYTGKDREFEYFKVPARASEEVINQILEVAKRFRSQVTAEGRHLPNGSVNVLKRGRNQEKRSLDGSRKRHTSSRGRSKSIQFQESELNLPSVAPNGLASNSSGGIKQNNSNNFLFNDNSRQNLNDMVSLMMAHYLGNANAQLHFGDTSTTASVGGGTIDKDSLTAFGVPPTTMYDWLYNPLLLAGGSGSYGMANATALQKWALLQSTLLPSSTLPIDAVDNGARSQNAFTYASSVNGFNNKMNNPSILDMLYRFGGLPSLVTPGKNCVDNTLTLNNQNHSPSTPLSTLSGSINKPIDNNLWLQQLTLAALSSSHLNTVYPNGSIPNIDVAVNDTQDHRNIADPSGCDMDENKISMAV